MIEKTGLFCHNVLRQDPFRYMYVFKQILINYRGIYQKNRGFLFHNKVPFDNEEYFVVLFPI